MLQKIIRYHEGEFLNGTRYFSGKQHGPKEKSACVVNMMDLHERVSYILVYLRKKWISVWIVHP